MCMFYILPIFPFAHVQICGMLTICLAFHAVGRASTCSCDLSSPFGLQKVNVYTWTCVKRNGGGARGTHTSEVEF
jgi:hypothetical protein